VLSVSARARPDDGVVESERRRADPDENGCEYGRNE
jgi:hypothetical protein